MVEYVIAVSLCMAGVIFLMWLGTSNDQEGKVMRDKKKLSPVEIIIIIVMILLALYLLAVLAIGIGGFALIGFIVKMGITAALII